MATTAQPPRSRRSRMLAAVALAGAAALVTGCGIESDPGSAPGPPAIVGADPMPLDAAQLQAPGLLDDVTEDGAALRWIVPGESIAVVVGGSGAGGECIPQPQAAGLEPNAPSIVVRFDPPNPAVMCTADFAMHGWQLGLAQSVDADAIVPVRFVNLQGTDDVIDLELGPDDLLAGETANPQPSEIPDAAGEAPDPTAIPDSQLPDITSVIADPQASSVVVQWIEPGRSLAIMLGGSSTDACVPQPIGVTSTGIGTIEAAFEPASGDANCDGDLRLYGWQLTLAAAVSATLPVEVTVTGAAADGAATRVTVAPDDILALP